jgi:hypothetical protein
VEDRSRAHDAFLIRIAVIIRLSERLAQADGSLRPMTSPGRFAASKEDRVPKYRPRVERRPSRAQVPGEKPERAERDDVGAAWPFAQRITQIAVASRVHTV